LCVGKIDVVAYNNSQRMMAIEHIRSRF